MEFIAPPFVVIIGFDNQQEIDDVMEKFIAETGQYLFTVVRGSVGETIKGDGPLDRWCLYRGCPQIFLSAKTQYALVNLLNHWVDYVVAKITSETPQAVRNFVMSMKQMGKHGMIVR